jgi:hypothetical protein
MSERTFIPVAVDAMRPIDGEDMVRVTYFAITTDAPGTVWEVELPALAQLQGVGVLGMAGIVYSAMQTTLEAGPDERGQLFTDPDQITAIFSLEGPGSPFSIQVEDVWMPRSWFDDAPAWEDPSGPPAADAGLERGEVYRVGVGAFREAYRFTAGDLGIELLREVDVTGQVLWSPLETAAVAAWSQGQIEIAREAFASQPLKLRWRG